MNTLLMIVAGILGLTVGGMFLIKVFWIIVEFMWWIASELSTWFFVIIILLAYLAVTNPQSLHNIMAALS